MGHSPIMEKQRLIIIISINEPSLSLLKWLSCLRWRAAFFFFLIRILFFTCTGLAIWLPDFLILLYFIFIFISFYSTLKMGIWYPLLSKSVSNYIFLFRLLKFKCLYLLNVLFWVCLLAHYLIFWDYPPTALFSLFNAKSIPLIFDSINIVLPTGQCGLQNLKFSIKDEERPYRIITIVAMF